MGLLEALLGAFFGWETKTRGGKPKQYHQQNRKSKNHDGHVYYDPERQREGWAGENAERKRKNRR